MVSLPPIKGKVGDQVDLLIPKIFDGRAGRQGDVLAFIPQTSGRVRDAIYDAEVDGQPTRLRVFKPTDYDADVRPFLHARPTRA